MRSFFVFFIQKIYIIFKHLNKNASNYSNIA
nr:MAG TPA: hypothetical protein [Caudoviricetes sp.]